MEELNRLKEIKILLKTGKITYQEAKEKAQPLLDNMNKRGKEIAKKFKRKYHDITFIGFMR